MHETIDEMHTRLTYIAGSLKNVDLDSDGIADGFIFAISNPPVPLGGNVVGLDLYVDGLPVPRRNVVISTARDVKSAEVLEENNPIQFMPYDGARFLVRKRGGLEEGRHEVTILSKLGGFEQIMIPFRLSDQTATEFGNAGFVTERYDFPIILAGRKAYAVASGTGALSAYWSWMGVRYDNGGLYVPPARSLGRVVIELSAGGSRGRLDDAVESSELLPGVLHTRHRLLDIEVARRLFVPLQAQGCVMELELINRGPLVTNVDLHVLADGNITNYGLLGVTQRHNFRFVDDLRCVQVTTPGLKYSGVIGANLNPKSVILGTYDNKIELRYGLRLEPEGPVRMRIAAAGSYTSVLEARREYLYLIRHGESLGHYLQDHYRRFLTTTVGIRTGNQVLDDAFTLAKVALEYLKADYPEIGIGVCAGLPRFPNYWGRDTGWALRGYVSMGDYEFTRDAIENFLNRQAGSTDYAVRAKKGEIPMIISGRQFLHGLSFGAADATLLFAWPILHYVRRSGDLAFLRRNWERVAELVEWGARNDVDGDGLLEHGPTETRDKIPIRDSTWMDHIDRRKSANDVQALYAETLQLGADLASMIGDGVREKMWREKAEAEKGLITSKYWDERSGFFCDTIRRDGTPDESIRPNALVLLLAHVATDYQAQNVLERIEALDMSTEWGVRTLSSHDPKYNPTLYHDGAVWPLVTGWAAVAELRYGRIDTAYRYLECMARRIVVEKGMYAETYRGDRAEPFNSNILQAWSVAMFTYAVMEMMGIEVDSIKGMVRIEPRLPSHLRQVQISNIRAGRDILNFMINPQDKNVAVTVKGLDRLRLESSSYEIRSQKPA